MAKLFVPSQSSSIPPQLVHPPNPDRRFPCLPVSFATSRLRVPKRHLVGTENGHSKFNWMNTVGGNVELSVTAPTSVPVRVAHELLQAGHHYLDVRTPEEFAAEHAAGAINVPYMSRAGSEIVGKTRNFIFTKLIKTASAIGMIKNSKFLETVLSHFGKDDEIIVGCQSGKRSLMAATELMLAGFTAVIDISGGYSVWTQNSLPTES